MFIVCWMETTLVDHIKTDHYATHETYTEALVQYNQLRKRNEVYSANIAEVVHSTDYEAKLRSCGHRKWKLIDIFEIETQGIRCEKCCTCGRERRKTIYDRRHWLKYSKRYTYSHPIEWEKIPVKLD